MNGPVENTDRELWRERPGDYYADSLHVTETGSIGMNCGGYVIVMPIREWHKLGCGPSRRAPAMSLRNFFARLWDALAEVAQERGRAEESDPWREEVQREQEERDARRRELERRPGYPHWPTGIVLPVGAIECIRERQRDYERDPESYERRERNRREEREQEEMREREEEERYYRWRQEGGQ